MDAYHAGSAATAPMRSRPEGQLAAALPALAPHHLEHGLSDFNCHCPEGSLIPVRIEGQPAWVSVLERAHLDHSGGKIVFTGYDSRGVSRTHELRLDAGGGWNFATPGYERA
ncbi:hypothetical protein [Caldimonas tepidiphila]|uniref:hypothetical protein n=1 Tax=Caldimonas tepidiphila TaxID=2315841 RepID=UPI000E5A355C|nr:hypothetical protein [Caldimonas tepidiphila]